MGGCVSSRSEFPNSVHPNIFTVYPVTRSASAEGIEAGAARSSSRATGQLQVTSNELILHLHGREPVRWPLQYVRRYGYENHLFSFESGRRCESGPGIFTFRCRRARDLFLMVQANVQEARTPPPAPQRLDPMADGLVCTWERGRSGSVPSQSQLPKEYAQAVPNGGQVVVLTGRRLNSTASDSAVTGFHSLPISSYKPTDNATVKNRNGASTDTDELSGSQVFPEVGQTSSEQSQMRLQPRHALGCSRSHASSESSDHSSLRREKQGQLSFNRRPASFEFVPSGASSSPMDVAEGDNSAFISPRDEAGNATDQSPVTPPSILYYVNVHPSTQGAIKDPATSTRMVPQLYHNKLVTSLRKAPGRSQSLGSSSPPTPNRRSDQCSSSKTGDFYYNDVKSSSASPSFRKSHVNDPLLNNNSECGPLHYITVDVGSAAPNLTNGRNAWTTSMPSSFSKRHGAQNSKVPVVAGRSLTSVSEAGSNSSLHKSHVRGQNPASEANANRPECPAVVHNNAAASTASNYASIDCARTKALRETAAAAQLQRRSASCSASSSEAVETAPTAAGRWKRQDGYSMFGRRKHHSGNVHR